MAQHNDIEPQAASDAPVQRNQQDIRAHNQTVILAAAEEEFVLQGFRGRRCKALLIELSCQKPTCITTLRRKNLYQAVLHSIIQEWNDGLVAMNVDSDLKQSSKSLSVPNCIKRLLIPIGISYLPLKSSAVPRICMILCRRL